MVWDTVTSKWSVLARVQVESVDRHVAGGKIVRGGRLGAGEGCRGRAVADGAAQAVFGRGAVELGEQVAGERAVARADGARDADPRRRPRATRRRRR